VRNIKEDIPLVELFSEDGRRRLLHELDADANHSVHNIVKDVVTFDPSLPAGEGMTEGNHITVSTALNGRDPRNVGATFAHEVGHVSSRVIGGLSRSVSPATALDDLLDDWNRARGYSWYNTIKRDLDTALDKAMALDNHEIYNRTVEEVRNEALARATLQGKPGSSVFLKKEYITVDGDTIKPDELIARPPVSGISPKSPYSQRIRGMDAKGGNTRSDTKGGDTPGASGAPAPEGSAPAQPGGPRIVVNPQVFRDRRDALCVAFNEAFRVVMEENGFEPVSEPTEKQRKFFADTAYANDELQLRRTILARIATLDTSVSDPTDEQLEETVEMLEMVMEVGAPQNEWEQQAVQRLHDVVAKAREGHVQNEEQPEAPQDEASTQADVGGGVTDEDKATAWEAGKRFDMGKGKYFLAGEKEGEGEIRWSADDSVAMGGVTGFKSWGKRGANSNFEYKTDTGSLRFETYDENGEKLRTWNQSLARIDRKANDGHVIKAGEVVAETIQLHRPEGVKLADGASGTYTYVESRNNVSGEVKKGSSYPRLHHPGLKYMRTWEPGARIDMGQGKFFLAGADKGTGAIYGADGSAIHRNVTDFSMTHVDDHGTDFNYVTDTGAHRTEHLLLPDSKNTSSIKSAIYSKSGDLLSKSTVDTEGTYHQVQRRVHGTNLATVTERSVLTGTMEKPEVYAIDITTGERLAAGGDGDSVGATTPNPAPSILPQPAAPQPAAPQPAAPQPAPSIAPPAPGKSGNSLAGDAPSTVPDEPTDGVVVGPGGRKTYKDASGRRITRDAWRKLHGLA